MSLIPPWLKWAGLALGIAAGIAAYQWQASAHYRAGYEAAIAVAEAAEKERIRIAQQAALKESERRRQDEIEIAQEQAAIVAAAKKERDNAQAENARLVAAAQRDRGRLRDDVRVRTCDGAAAPAAAASAGGEPIAQLSADRLRDVLQVVSAADAELAACWGIAKSDREPAHE
jgi:hypothetical protein